MGLSVKGCLSAVVLMLALSSCASMKMPFVPDASGELRLKSARLPEVMQAHVSYELVLQCESEGAPRIERVCLRWMEQDLSVGSPSLYAYAQEVQGNDQIGSFAPRWTSEGKYSKTSQAFCVKPAGVAYGSPGSITVTLPPENVKAGFNRLEAYVEYVFEGQRKESNRVAAKTLIQD